MGDVNRNMASANRNEIREMEVGQKSTDEVWQSLSDGKVRGGIGLLSGMTLAEAW